MTVDVRISHRKKEDKLKRFNHLLEIMKLWDLKKIDVANISDVPYNTVLVGFKDDRRISIERLNKYFSDMKNYIKTNPQSFSDLTITDEMMTVVGELQ